MNLQQLEYIVAVDTYRHFQRASEKCFVTQPTLSMMIHKLEDELGLKIFDRAQQPVEPTREGAEVILRAKTILAEAKALRTYANELRNETAGEIHLGIIPTLAPYLLPLFLKPFMKKNPNLKIFVKELVTEDLTERVRTGELDIAIMATPLEDDRLSEHTLFNEEFYAYASSDEKLPRKKYLLPREIDVRHLWLLEEGNCMRNQVFNLCELKRAEEAGDSFHYEAGSIESLVNLVDHYHGITIIPALAAQALKSAQRKKIREFAKPKPVRQISLVTAKNFPRRKLLHKLQEEIVACLPVSHAGGEVISIR